MQCMILDWTEHKGEMGTEDVIGITDKSEYEL